MQYVVAFLGMLALIVILAFLGAIITQFAWNNSIAEIFKVSEIGFFQAFCLNLLGGMVCKSSSSSSSSK